MEKLIYNHKKYQITILDSNNKPLLSSIDNTTDINFSTLPSNIFSNILLYLGNEYELYNFDYQYVYSLLINDDIYLDKELNEYKDKDGKWLYNYDLKNETLWVSYDRITLVLITKYGFNWTIVKQLCQGILEVHYKWKVVTTSDFFWQW